MNKEAIKLLDRLYNDLYKSESVINHGNGNIYDKFNNIESYINDLENMHKRVSETGRHKDYLKKLYYEKYVIKLEDIKESYYKHQQEIVLERGYGYIDITDELKEQLQEEIITNQKRSLDTWLDYFLSTDADVYPFWAKYWAFQGMLKLGTYDKEKGTFNKRTKDTIEPFCDLNREALAMSIDMLIKMLNKEEFDDNELEALVKTGSFQKIYTYILNNVLKDNKNITKRNIGKWIKYDRGSDHMPLVKSLEGYNTGWCTAGASTAKSQLEVGDFYVYYTLDENDEYKVPRIAIRMEYGRIAEIRGIAKDQNLETEMEEVVEEKIKDFPDKEEYYKKVNDMKMLTHIYKKHKNKEELTKEELRFLYEIDYEIIGFGYDNDPRIEEIKNERGTIREDIAYILDYKADQVALIRSEINKNTLYYNGDLDYGNLTSAEGVLLPHRIKGYLDLSNLRSAKGLKLPEQIGGFLDLSNLRSAKGLKLPKQIDGSLILRDLISCEGLELPKKIGYNLNLNSLTSAKGLNLPYKIGGCLFLDRLKSAKYLNLSIEIKNNLYLSGLKTAKHLKLPYKIVGDLDLSGLKSTDELELPKQIIGDLDLGGLESAKGLNLPIQIDGSLILRKLTSAKDLELPQTIGGDLDLSGLKSAESLNLPDKIGGDLDLSGLESSEGLNLPSQIKGYLIFKKLTSIEGLIIPDPLTYTINFKYFEITPENVDQYRNNKIK